MRRLTAIIIFLGIACQTFSQVYNDLSDYGYRGRIKSISARIYFDIYKVDEKWVIKDLLRPRTRIVSQFNLAGNFTQRDVIYEASSFTTIFQYNDKIKTGWIKRDGAGVIVEKGKYKRNGNHEFSEVSFDTTGKKRFESTHTLSRKYRTICLNDKGYDEAGRLHYNTQTQYEDDIDGRLYKFTVTNLLDSSKSNYKFIIVKKDRKGNVVESLLEKDGKPVEIRLFDIKYR